MKRKIAIANIILAATMMLTSCNTPQDSKESVSVSSEQGNIIKAKETKYATDETTEVLLDAPEINKEDIVKIIQHGDHWHVFTQDGKEHITYTDPNNMEAEVMEMVSVVTLDRLKSENVKEIKVHDNHWHVFTQDGSEYLTYEDPSKVFPDIIITKYTGSHSANKKSKMVEKNTLLVNEKKDSNQIIKILKHGDHYHLYTSAGEEFITYEDPRPLYPNAVFGTYTGSHAAMNKQMKKKSSPIIEQILAIATDKSLIKTNAVLNKKIQFVSVVTIEQLKNMKIEKILKHGDHYHVYTVSGKEFITYEDPSSAFPNIKIGTYVGNHSTGNEVNTLVNPEDVITGGNGGSSGTIDPNKVVRILRHDDHWHVYTASGEETIAYEDPSWMYPDAEVGIYTGTHAPLNGGSSSGGSSSQSGNSNSGKEKKKPVFIKTIKTEQELNKIEIKKIKKHGDHYHIYDRDNKEFITYLPLGEIGEKWHDILIEEYVGNHGDHYDNTHSDESVTPPENTEDNVLELYNSVEPELKEGIARYLTPNMIAMTAFGNPNLNITTAVMPTGGYNDIENVFYWLHGDHYHTLSIRYIVSEAKKGSYGTYTEKDMIAALKYIVTHPEEKENIKVDYAVTTEQAIDYLTKHYKIDWYNGVSSPYKGRIEIKNQDKDVVGEFELIDFTIEEGKLKYQGKDLPELNLLKKENSNETDDYEDSSEPLSDRPSTVSDEETSQPETNSSESETENNVQDMEEYLEKRCLELNGVEIWDIFDYFPGVRLLEMSFPEKGVVVIKGQRYDIFTGKQIVMETSHN